MAKRIPACYVCHKPFAAGERRRYVYPVPGSKDNRTGGEAHPGACADGEIAKLVEAGILIPALVGEPLR